MSRPVRILLKVVYWLAVLAVSLALLVGLILLFDSRDDSDIEGGRAPGPGLEALVACVDGCSSFRSLP